MAGVALDAFGLIVIDEVELGEIARGNGLKMMAIGMIQNAFPADLMDLDLATGAADVDFPAQGIAVVEAPHRGLDMDRLAGMVCVEAKGGNKLLIDVKPLGFRNFPTAIVVPDIERSGKGRGSASAQHGGQKQARKAQ